MTKTDYHKLLNKSKLSKRSNEYFLSLANYGKEVWIFFILPCLCVLQGSNEHQMGLPKYFYTLGVHRSEKKSKCTPNFKLQ